MSKLSKEFPMADPAKYLLFDNSWQKDIDPVFAGRLAALARDMGVKIHINSGKRATEEQTRLYKQDGGYQDKNGNWVGGTGYVAVPGRSWHEFGEAIDTRDPWLKKLEKDAATNQQILLQKYGLFKPLTKGNRCTVLEDWHIQPIETMGVPVAKRMEFLKAYKEAAIQSQPAKKEESEMWKKKIIEEAFDLGLITDKTWIEKADEKPTIWFVCAVAINLYKKIKG